MEMLGGGYVACLESKRNNINRFTRIQNGIKYAALHQIVHFRT